MIYQNLVIQNFKPVDLLKNYQISESKQFITKKVSSEDSVDTIKTLSKLGIMLKTNFVQVKDETYMIQENFDGILLELLKSETDIYQIQNPLSELLNRLIIESNLIFQDHNIFNIVYQYRNGKYQFFIFHYNTDLFQSIYDLKNEKKVIKSIEKHEQFLSPFSDLKLNIKKSEILSKYSNYKNQ